MSDFNKEDHHKIRQLENELKEVKKELYQLKAGGEAVGNDQMAKRLAQLEMVDRARRFSSTLPPPNSDRKIVLQNGHKFTPDIGAFIRNGAAYCRDLSILRGPNNSAFHGYPPEFFNELIKHFHASENPDEMVASVNIALALDNPARWPAALVQLHAAHFGWISKEQWEKDVVPTLKEENVDYDDKMVEYTMGNKHKPEARFKLCIYFEGRAQCHQQMTRFAACRTDDITTSADNEVEQGEGEQKERKLEAELQKVNAQNAKLEKEMGAMQKEVGALKDQLGDNNLELQQMNAKNGNLEKEMRAMKEQLGNKNSELQKKNEKLEKEMGEVKDQLNEHKNHQIIQIANQAQTERKLNAELQKVNAKNGKLDKEMVEMKDQLGTKNGKLEREMGTMQKEMGVLKDQLNEVIENYQIDQIVICYARTLPASDFYGYISFQNGHQYMPEMDNFVRYGAAHCRAFFIRRGTGAGFVDYPANFFDNLIKHYYETKVPKKAVHCLDIELPLTSPAPWPSALLQPRAGEINVEELGVDNAGKWVHYSLRNQHNPGIAFELWIWSEGRAKCYQKMITFGMRRV